MAHFRGDSTAFNKWKITKIQTSTRAQPGFNLKIINYLDKCTNFGTLAWVKKVIWHPDTLKSIKGFPEKVKKDFGYLIMRMQLGEILITPHSKSMNSVASGVHELRVKDLSGIYRAFYILKFEDSILVFHAFKKKTQKTPKKEISVGKSHLKEMINEIK